MSHTAGSASVAEALEACAVVERALVVRAALRLDGDDLAALEDALRRLRLAPDPRTFVARDLLRRRRIARAARSRHLARMLASFHGSLTATFVDAASRCDAVGAEDRVAHRAALVGALAAGAARAAADAVERMLGEACAATVGGRGTSGTRA
jgi:DNA-binding FadR family transcriptional regulator